jgi:hypothetical protein
VQSLHCSLIWWLGTCASSSCSHLLRTERELRFCTLPLTSSPVKWTIPILESTSNLSTIALHTFFINIIFWVRSVKLISDSENIQRLFIDEFMAHMEFVGPALLLFYDSLTVHDNCENLRSKYVLNPTSDGDSMGMPARMMVSSAFWSPCHAFFLQLVWSLPWPRPMLTACYILLSSTQGRIANYLCIPNSASRP